MSASAPSLYLERSGPLQRFWGLFRQAWVAGYEDNCFGIAKGVAYSGLLAFFPVLASIAAILAKVNAESVAHVLELGDTEAAPSGSELRILGGDAREQCVGFIEIVLRTRTHHERTKQSARLQILFAHRAGQRSVAESAAWHTGIFTQATRKWTWRRMS